MLLQTASFHSQFFSILTPPAFFRFFCLFLTLVVVGGGPGLPSTRDECFLVKCRLLGFAFCGNSPDGPLPAGWPSSSLEAPRLALPSGLQKPHLPVWGSTHLLLCSFHVTHASFQAVSGSRFITAGRPPGWPFPLDPRSHTCPSGAALARSSVRPKVTHASSFRLFLAPGSSLPVHVMFPSPSSHSGFSWRWGTA